MPRIRYFATVGKRNVEAIAESAWLDHQLPEEEREPDDDVYFEAKLAERYEAARKLAGVAKPRSEVFKGYQCLSPGALEMRDGEWRWAGKWHSTSRSLDPTVMKGERLPIPCNLCEVCRVRQQRELVIRAFHEAQLASGPSWFVTLTHSDETLPGNGSLDHEIFSKFMKRFRKQCDTRMMMCGEYGPTTGRAHYHALLFGAEIPDIRPYGSEYRSPLLEKAWGQGIIHIGLAEHAAIRYVAGYVTKKLSFERGAQKLEWRNVSLPDKSRSWEEVRAEYGLASRNPGLGARFADEFYPRVFQEGNLIVQGKEVKRIPNYYLRRWAKGMKPESPGAERKPFPGYDLFLAKRTEAAQEAGPPLSFEQLAFMRENLLETHRVREREAKAKRKR